MGRKLRSSEAKIAYLRCRGFTSGRSTNLTIPYFCHSILFAIRSFSDDYFSHCSNILTLFNKLSVGLPTKIINSFFPQTISQHGPQTFYLILLPSFPLSNNADDLLKSFQNIFSYLPPNISIKIVSTLLFASPIFPQLPLFIVLLCLSANCTMTGDAKARTSESKRPLVIRLCSILLEIPGSSPSSESQHLVIEQFHPESQSVTVYDPRKGVYTRPVDTLQSFEITALIFKRASTKNLICPQLLKDFCSLPIKAPTPSHTSLAVLSPSLMEVVVLLTSSPMLLINGHMLSSLRKWMLTPDL